MYTIQAQTPDSAPKCSYSLALDTKKENMKMSFQIYIVLVHYKSFGEHYSKWKIYQFKKKSLVPIGPKVLNCNNKICVGPTAKK